MKSPSNLPNLAFVDIETTGLDRQKHEIIEIALLLVERTNFEIIDSWYAKIKPLNLGAADPEALRINHYNPKDWEQASHPKIALEEFSKKTADHILVSHNISFDRPFLEDHFRKWRVPVRWNYHSLDTVSFAFCKLKNPESLKLSKLAQFLGVKQRKEHSAIDDVRTCFEIFKKLVL